MFTVTTKVDYGLLIMVELAKQSAGNFVSLQEIADAHNISSKYLSKLVTPLKQAGLVKSKEGKTGGYQLAKSAEQITLREIIEAIEGNLQMVRCMHEDASCPVQETCLTKPVWNTLKADLYTLLEHKTLQEII